MSAQTSSPIYPHYQDAPTNCGRACAQAVVASINNSGAAPTNPIVSQAALEGLESTPPIPDVSAGWATTPLEMARVLNASTPGPPWVTREAVGRDACLALLEVGLEATGRPTLFARGAGDHWVVGYQVDTGDEATLYSFIDPRYRGGVLHTFDDTCHASRPMKKSLSWVKFADRMSEGYFALNGTPPDASGAMRQGMTVMVGPSLTAPQLQKAALLAQNMAGRAKLTNLLPADAVAPRVAQVALERLAWCARAFNVEDLRNLLPLLSVADAKFVTDLDNGQDHYVLVSLKSAKSQGVLAVFDCSPEAHLLEFTGTDSSDELDQLSHAVGPLGWTTQTIGSTQNCQRVFPYTFDTTGGITRVVRLLDRAVGMIHR